MQPCPAHKTAGVKINGIICPMCMGKTVLSAGEIDCRDLFFQETVSGAPTQRNETHIVSIEKDFGRRWKDVFKSYSVIFAGRFGDKALVISTGSEVSIFPWLTVPYKLIEQTLSTYVGARMVIYTTECPTTSVYNTGYSIGTIKNARDFPKKGIKPWWPNMKIVSMSSISDEVLKKQYAEFCVEFSPTGPVLTKWYATHGGAHGASAYQPFSWLDAEILSLMFNVVPNRVYIYCATPEDEGVDIFGPEEDINSISDPSKINLVSLGLGLKEVDELMVGHNKAISSTIEPIVEDDDDDYNIYGYAGMGMGHPRNNNLNTNYQDTNVNAWWAPVDKRKASLSTSTAIETDMFEDSQDDVFDFLMNLEAKNG